LFVGSVPALPDTCARSLPDALPIYGMRACARGSARLSGEARRTGNAGRPRQPEARLPDVAISGGQGIRLDVDHPGGAAQVRGPRSEEHTSELQSRENLVCRLLLEKK